MLKYGKVLDRNQFGVLKRNIIHIKSHTAEILLHDRNGNETGVTIIDTLDVDKVKNYKWNLMSHGYVSSGAGKDIILLHRLIAECPSDMYVDHINRNTLDNRRNNLRIVTNQQNNINKGLYSHNTSGYTGVVWDSSRDKWMAQIVVNDKNIHLGRFDNKEDAITARSNGEVQYFGEIMEGLSE